ncbi:transglycosylase family protein [Streptomyces qinzhouensis]|nr:transglycosylase family protein [Streptomyces qinzhouensis]
MAAVLALAGPTTPTAQAASVSTWDKVAQCESGGRWYIVSNTTPVYYGGLQFAQSTWDSFGGRQYADYANKATKREQILIAEKVLAVQGQGAWPKCGPAAGLGADKADPYPAPSEHGEFRHAIRTATGHWTPFSPLNGYDGAGRFDGGRQSVTSTPDGSLQILGTGTDGYLYHNARYSSGSWTGWQPLDGYDAAPRFAAREAAVAGMPNGDAQILAVGNDGIVYHTIRRADGSWQGWTAVSPWGARKVTATGMPNGDLQLGIIGLDGKLYHNARYANGGWQGWNAVAGYGGAPDFQSSALAIAALGNGDAQLLAIGADGGLYHSTRLVGGHWQAWGKVPGIDSATSIALTGMPNGDAQILAVANGTTVYHNARYANGGWQGWNPVGLKARAVGIAGLATGDAHILAITG